MSHPLPFERIIAYLAGELSAADEQAVEEHFFGCAACAAAVEEAQALVGAIAAAIPPVVSSARVERLRRAGVRVRATDIAPGQDVDVTFAPEVDILLHRLHAEVRGAGRIDMEIVDGDAVVMRFEAVPVDAEAGVVQVACQRHFQHLGLGDDVRFRLVAVGAEARDVLGEYLVRHHFV